MDTDRAHDMNTYIITQTSNISSSIPHMLMHPLTVQHTVEPLQVREATANLVPVGLRANQERAACALPGLENSSEENT